MIDTPAKEPTLFESFCAYWLSKALTKMKQGSLQVVYPNGKFLMLGDDAQSKSGYPVLRIHRPRFFSRCVLYGHIGFSEAYMEGDWDTDDLSGVISWFILNIDRSTVLEGSGHTAVLMNLLGWVNRIVHLVRPNSLATSAKNIQEHYDLSNDFFKLFLDPTMTYSSARFSSPEFTLEEAQIAKYEALCQKLKICSSDYVLEIGTGWGGFSEYAAKTYGCRIKTITISKAQYDYAVNRIKNAGLSTQVEVSLQDYRLVQGQFDKIVSIEMLEAVGDAYMEAYFGQCARLLKKEGLLGLQVITCPDSRYEILRKNVDFIQKHIFPGSLLPSLGRMHKAIARTSDLFLLDLDDMGNSYAKTLWLWNEAFFKQLDAIKSLGFNETFIRKWHYYFMYCHAAFVMRNITVVQAVYTRPNNTLLSNEYSKKRGLNANDIDATYSI